MNGFQTEGGTSVVLHDKTTPRDCVYLNEGTISYLSDICGKMCRLEKNVIVRDLY